MSIFRFLNPTQTDVIQDACRRGVETPPGSYAREVAKVGTLGDVDKLNIAELIAMGIVIVTLGTHDPAIETIAARDFERNVNGSIKITAQTVAEVLTILPIDPIVLSDRAATQLAQTQAAAALAIDAEAGNTRQEFITAIPGQDATYTAKEAEARRWVAEIQAGTAAPDPLAYPYLKDRAERLNATTPDYQAVATEWLVKADLWHNLNISIENVREGAKEAVTAAVDVTTAQTAQQDASAAFAAIIAAAMPV